MGDTENSLQPSKKRAAGREISRDNPGLDDDEEGTSEQEIGTFKRASDEVLASRRIVKVARHNQTSSTPSAPSTNPFAGIRLVPPPGSAATTAVVTDEAKSSKSQAENEANVDARKETDQDNNEKDKESESKVDEPKDEPMAEKDKNDGKEEKPESTDDKDKNDGEGDKPESTENKYAVGENCESKLKEDAEPDNPDKEAPKDPDVQKTEDEMKDDGGNGNVEKSGEDAEPDNPDKEAPKDPDVQKTEDEIKKDGGNGNVKKSGEAASFNSFHQLSSSQNAFTGLAGTGFSGSSFSFGSITKEGSSPGSGSGSGSGSGAGSIFGLKNDQPSFSFGLSNNGSSLFGSSGTSAINKSEGSGFPSMQEVPVETGEENEKPVFTADSVLFEYLDGVWKERGKGELKVNVSSTGTGKARLIMRTRGNYRLILNASLFPDMKLTNMDKRGITFACVNSIGEGKYGLSTFALKFKDASIVGEFRECVMEHKGKIPVALKTPENSPKATDD